MNKVIKNIKLNWDWKGDIYLLRGFNIAIMKEGADPSTNDLSGALAYTTIQSPKQILEKQKVQDDSIKFTYTFSNQMLDENLKIVPWIQALFDNSDSSWVSLDGAIIEDDGNATIVVIGNPTFQQVIDMASDSKITPQEKLALEKEWDEIVTDHYMTLLGAVKANLPSNHPDLMDYDNKIDLLASYLNYNNEYTFHPLDHEEYEYPSMITDGLTTDLNTLHYGGKDKYKKVFNDFYEAKVKLLETIRQAILDNNNDLIQDEIDKSTLPDTIAIGGYTTGNFEANKNYDSLPKLGTIRIGSGHFITTTGQKFKIDKPEEIVTNLSSNKTRFKYILFVGADKSRFALIDEKASSNYVSALPKNGEWWYFDGANDEYRSFTPIPEDCVVAKVEEHNSMSGEEGIRAIRFMCSSQQSVFDQLTDNGEQQFIGKDENGRLFINGEYIQAHTIKGSQILTNGLKAISTEDGRTTLEITETGEAYLDLKNFTLRAGGKINMQGVVSFESLDKDMQDNFVEVNGKTTINGDHIKTGTITANNNVSEFNLNNGTFRLGGTGDKDYKLYFDGVNLKFGDGSIEWPEMPAPDIPELDDFLVYSVSLSKDTMTIKVDDNGKPLLNEVGQNSKAVSALTVHRGSTKLTSVDEDKESLDINEFKYIITRAVNCVAKRKNNNEIYIESIENNRAVLGIEDDFAIIDGEGYLDSNINDGGYIELDVICGEKKQVLKKAISFSLVSEGKDGQDGSVGDAAKYIKITGEQLFKYNVQGDVEIESIDLKATTYNFYPTKIQWEYFDGLNWSKANGINNQQVYTVKHDSPDFKDLTSIRYRCLIDELFVDEITVSKLYDGLDGIDGVAYTVVLSNEAHTIACDEDGNPLEGEIGIQGLAVTDVTVYKNTEELKPIRITGGDYSTMQKGEYCIDIIEQNGCKADLLDADTIYIKEMKSISAYISINIICEGEPISVKKMSLVKAIKGQPGTDGIDGVDGLGSYIVVLTNDFHSIPTDNKGDNGNYTGCETSLIVLYGEDEIEADITAEPSDGVEGSLNKNVYTVTNMTKDSGYVDLTATINKRDYTKRFTITKNKSGEHGTSYWLLTDASVIKKNSDGNMVPDSINVSGKTQVGKEGIKDFECKFKISLSKDGSSFDEVYQSLKPESSYKYTIPKDALIIKFQMLKFDNDTILDEERIPVVVDGKNGQDGKPGATGPQGPPGPSVELPKWIEDWTSNSTTINGQSMLSPRIFAGTGGSSPTGVALGRQALGTADNSINIGMGIYANGNIIGKIKSTPDSDGVVVEFGTGNNKMTIDKFGNIKAPKMTAEEIVSSINNSTTSIDGGKITTGSITADQIAGKTITGAEISADAIEGKHIQAGKISVDKLSSNNKDPIIRLFNNCSIDATEKDEKGQGSSIRLKWDNNTYVHVGNSGGSTPFFNVYLGTGVSSTSDSSKRMELKYDSFEVLKPKNGSSYKYRFFENECKFYVNNLIMGDIANNKIFRIDADNGAARLYVTPKGTGDRGLKMESNCGRLEIKQTGTNFVNAKSGVSKELEFVGHNHSGESWNDLSVNNISIKTIRSYNKKDNNYIVFDSNIVPSKNEKFIGNIESRWKGIYCTNNPNVSSDKRLKDNIIYLDSDDTVLIDDDNYTVTNKMLHDFIKSELRLAEYDYKINNKKLRYLSSKEKEMNSRMRHRQIGFIAQDIKDTLVGKKIITEDNNGLLGYETGNFTSAIAGALKQEILERESEIKELKEIIKDLQCDIIKLKDKQCN